MARGSGAGQWQGGHLVELDVERVVLEERGARNKQGELVDAEVVGGHEDVDENRHEDDAANDLGGVGGTGLVVVMTMVGGRWRGIRRGIRRIPEDPGWGAPE